MSQPTATSPSTNDHDAVPASVPAAPGPVPSSPSPLTTAPETAAPASSARAPAAQAADATAHIPSDSERPAEDASRASEQCHPTAAAALGAAGGALDVVATTASKDTEGAVELPGEASSVTLAADAAGEEPEATSAAEPSEPGLGPVETSADGASKQEEAAATKAQGFGKRHCEDSPLAADAVPAKRAKTVSTA